ncbi:RagB/SusD family nutrient uptake outer membrane protein [Chitinophaga sp. Hz27]|uniref:RagB/SusD family nutrient uptake outer membrane protein n=1 Tax=Chitinophaga sp. Hz27 TaxID=3347169 RepID=UPI0035D91329
MITNENVFSTDGTAIMATTGIYAQISDGDITNGFRSLNLNPSLYVDELNLRLDATSSMNSYFINNLSATVYGGEYWSNYYYWIYRCNDIISEINTAKSLSANVKKELLGEATFMRALFYYYLVNFYGNTCFVTSTDYTINNTIPRIDATTLLQGLVNDLLNAQNNLSDTFLDGSLATTTQNRYRPNKYAASMLLTKIYLQIGKWDLAETQATTIINNNSLFQMSNVNNTFSVNNQEAIWQLQSVSSTVTTAEGLFYSWPDSTYSSAHPCTISKYLLSAFEPKDLRRSNWVNTISNGNDTFYIPFKYKVFQPEGSPSEALTIFRLADAYLCRAEARAQLSKLTDAISDINVIRTRAGLDSLVGLNQQQCLDAILHERQVEFFTEFGSRFIDLKRFNKLNEVMTVVAPAKGGVWKPEKALFPLPAQDLSRNVKLTQNTGY